jgi:hypothetical protein
MQGAIARYIRLRRIVGSLVYYAKSHIYDPLSVVMDSYF